MIFVFYYSALPFVNNLNSRNITTAKINTVIIYLLNRFNTVDEIFKFSVNVKFREHDKLYNHIVIKD